MRRQQGALLGVRVLLNPFVPRILRKFTPTSQVPGGVSHAKRSLEGVSVGVLLDALADGSTEKKREDPRFVEFAFPPKAFQN